VLDAAENATSFSGLPYIMPRVVEYRVMTSTLRVHYACVVACVFN